LASNVGHGEHPFADGRWVLSYWEVISNELHERLKRRGEKSQHEARCMMMGKGREAIFNSARHWKNNAVKWSYFKVAGRHSHISTQFIITTKKVCRKITDTNGMEASTTNRTRRKSMRSRPGDMILS